MGDRQRVICLPELHKRRLIKAEDGGGECERGHRVERVGGRAGGGGGGRENEIFSSPPPLGEGGRDQTKAPLTLA